MKNNTLLFVGAGVLLLFLLGNNAGAAVLDNGGLFNFAALTGTYAADKVQRLSDLYDAMQGKGLSTLQVTLMLSQALFETGLFTNNPNYRNMDNLNNYAGITANSRFPAAPGSGYAQYPDLDTFVNDWIYVLGFNNQPINATGVNDFVTRLKENGYFTANTSVYENGVQQYFNLLTGIINQA